MSGVRVASPDDPLREVSTIDESSLSGGQGSTPTPDAVEENSASSPGVTVAESQSQLQAAGHGRPEGASSLHLSGGGRRTKEAPVVIPIPVSIPPTHADMSGKDGTDTSPDGEEAQAASGETAAKAARPKSSIERMVDAVLSKAWSHVSWTLPVVQSWPKMKPLIRSSITGWLCLLMLLIAPIETRLGNASFLILIAAFISPSELPFFAMLEREFFTLLLLLCAWAWTCLGIFIADRVRRTHVSAANADPNVIFTGTYIEARSSVVLAVFLAFGSGAALYLKARFGPSPFLFGSILSCILLDICLANAALFPYPYYTIATTVIVPLSLKSAINIAVSAVFFPKTVNSQYVERLMALLQPLRDAHRDQVTLLKRSPLDSEFNFSLVHDLVTKAEGSIAPLHMASRLLMREFSFGIANGQDLKTLENLAIDLVPSADGHSYYYSIIRNDLKHAHFPRTPAASRFATPATTPAGTPQPSRPPSPSHDSPAQAGRSTPPVEGSAVSLPGSDHFTKSIEHGLKNRKGSRPASTVSATGRQRHVSHQHHHPWAHLLHFSHHNQGHHSPHEPVPVGVWESLRYEGVEFYLHSKGADQHTELFAHLLGETSKDILLAAAASLDHILDWLRKLNSERMRRFRERLFQSREAQIEAAKKRADKTREVINQLEAALEKFENIQRLNVLDPFRKHLDPTAPYLARANSTSIPHRYLYQAWVHQFHSIQFANKLLALLAEVRRIDVERQGARVWGPDLSKLFKAETWHVYGDSSYMQEEEDPQSIPCASGGTGSDDRENLTLGLGDAKARDPEALPVDTWLGVQGYNLYKFSHKLFQGNLLFSWKVAALTALISLPSFMRSSAHFMYKEKGIWAIFMAQLTAARFRGETAFGLFSRIASTIAGAAIGLVIWYIGAGNGRGSPYGVAAVAAVCFPIVYLIRLYLPGPPITAIITCVTVALVVGYSYKDGHNPAYSSPGVGWVIGWKRLAAAAAGCAAAFFWALLPPTSTGRKYQRLSHATTIAELGRLHCDLVSLVAHHRPAPEDEVTELRLRLVAVRAKLRRLQASTASLGYEFSLRGKWPAERYAALSNVQMEIAKLQSHLIAVSEGLSPKYATALLRRTRFLDPLFLGDCISVISLCSTALRTARPLPQITACPLVDRFLLFEHGTPRFARNKDDDDDTGEWVDEKHRDGSKERHHRNSSRERRQEEQLEDDLGLPKLMTMATLQEKDFMVFAVGLSTSLGIVLRLDKLCIAVKELVGESFAVTADIHRRNVIRGQDWGKYR